MTLGIEREGLAEPLRDLVRRRHAVLGTCAGLIMLDRAHLGLMDIAARAQRLRAPDALLRGRPRVPRRSTASRCARCSSARRGSPSTAPASRSSPRSTATPSPRGRAVMLVVSFHPELGGDDRLHGLFLDRCGRSAAASSVVLGTGSDRAPVEDHDRHAEVAHRCAGRGRMPRACCGVGPSTPVAAVGARRAGGSPGRRRADDSTGRSGSSSAGARLGAGASWLASGWSAGVDRRACSRRRLRVTLVGTSCDRAPGAVRAERGGGPVQAAAERGGSGGAAPMASRRRAAGGRASDHHEPVAHGVLRHDAAARRTAGGSPARRPSCRCPTGGCRRTAGGRPSRR